MSAHRGEAATVKVAHVLNTALRLFATDATAVGEDARTGGAYFRASLFGRRFTVRVTEVDQ